MNSLRSQGKVSAHATSDSSSPVNTQGDSGDHMHPSLRSPPSSRKALPQPVEETKRSNRASNGLSSRGLHGTLPQPVETISESQVSSKDFRSAAVKQQQDGKDASRDTAVGITSTSTTHSLPQPMECPTSAPKPRRFAPQMVETSRRSRRNTDSSMAEQESNHTDRVPAPRDHLPQHMRRKDRPSLLPGPPDNSPVVSTDQVPKVPESRFSSSKLAERAPRRHSFRIPELAAITSTSDTEEDSNASDTPSLNTTLSADSDGASRSKRKRKTKQAISTRESQDERFSGYLLTLAASAAEKQLREQAMAAYPNENVHEPVDHYTGDRDSEDSDMEVHMGRLDVEGLADEEQESRKRLSRTRRDSGIRWELEEMRVHQDKLDQEKQDQWVAGAEEKPSEFNRRRSLKQNLVENGLPPSSQAGVPPKEIIGWQKDNELAPQRKAASPPMAGSDLRFPKCLSPQATRMDVHQYPGARQSIGVETRQHSGLWTPAGGQSRKASQSGLWMGVNAASAQPQPVSPRSIQSGLLTPAVERLDPFTNTISSTTTTSSTSIATPSPIPDPQQPTLPPSPPASQLSDPIPLHHTKSLQEELSDEFITQIYNYLSLGYPTLARPYDHELSKITLTPVSCLRKDDDKCNVKGYIGAPEGTGLDVRGVGEGACERWLALRKYVWEWGRQQKGNGWDAERVDGYGGGVAARKGSWAW